MNQVSYTVAIRSLAHGTWKFEQISDGSMGKRSDMMEQCLHKPEQETSKLFVHLLVTKGTPDTSNSTIAKYI